MDNVEEYIWSSSLQWGYYKHPPLPTWLAHGAIELLGYNSWALYALGGLLYIGSLALFWKTLQLCQGRTFATLALLAACGITFYNGRINYYNHNTVIAFLTALSAYLFVRLHLRGRLLTWALFGLVLAMGMLSKYQFALTIAALSLAYMWLGMWRQPQQLKGATLAFMVCTLALAPHLYWLAHTPFGPIQYAMHSSLGAGLTGQNKAIKVLTWTLDWLFNRSLLAWAFLLFVRFSKPAKALTDRAQRPDTYTPVLLLLGWGPLLMMMAMGAVAGVDLQLQWPTAFSLWTVPAVMLLPVFKPLQQLKQVPLKAYAAFAIIQILLMVLSWVTSPFGPKPSRPAHWREFPSAALAQAMQTIIQPQLGQDIQIISGPPNPAGAIALRLPTHPKVLVDGQLQLSPWLTEKDIQSTPIVHLTPLADAPSHASKLSDEWAAYITYNTKLPEPINPPPSTSKAPTPSRQ